MVTPIDPKTRCMVAPRMRHTALAGEGRKTDTAERAALRARRGRLTDTLDDEEVRLMWTSLSELDQEEYLKPYNEPGGAKGAAGPADKRGTGPRPPAHGP